MVWQNKMGSQSMPKTKGKWLIGVVLSQNVADLIASRQQNPCSHEGEEAASTGTYTYTSKQRTESPFCLCRCIGRGGFQQGQL